MADMELQLRLSADGKGLTGVLRTASGEVREFAAEAKQAGEGITRTMDDAQKSVSAANKTIGAAGKELTGTLRTVRGEVRQVATDTKQAGEDSTRAMSESQKAFISAGKIIGTAIAGVAAGFALMVKNQIDYADKVGSTAKRLSVSAESLSALGALAKRNNADFSSITSGLDALGNAAASMAVKGSRGGREFAGAFAALNVSVRDASGVMKPQAQLLGEVAASLAKLPEGAYKSKLATTLLGSAGKELNASLDELANVGLQGVIDKATETGEVISTEAAARAKEFNDQIQALTTKVTVFAQGVGQDVVPTLLALANAFDDTSEGAGTAGDESSTLRTVMEKLGLVVVVVGETLKVLFTMLYGGIDIMIGLGTATVQTVIGISNAVQAVQAFQAGNMQAAAEFSTRAKGAFVEGWSSISGSATRAWNAITSAGAEGDAKIAEYNRRIADGYKKTGEAAANGAEIAGAAARAAAIAAAEQEAAQKRHAAALANTAAAARKTAEEEKRLAKAVRGFVEQTDRITRDAGIALISDEDTRAAAEFAVAVADMAAAAVAAGIPLDEITARADAMTAAYLSATPAVRDLQAQLNGATGAKVSGQDQLADLIAELNGAKASQIAYNKILREAERAYARAGGAANAQAKAIFESVKANAAATQGTAEQIETLEKVGDFLDKYAEQKSPFEKMLDDLDGMQDLLAKLPELMGDAFDPAVAKELENAIRKTRIELAQQFIGVAKESLQSIQSMTQEGSRSFQALQVAIDATTVAEAVLALVHQLSAGDVYTAIPRMIAVAAAIASLGVSIGNVASGGFSDTAAQRQETQGTGSVLGDSEAKSESIANSVEITAKASEQLVALNRGMLNALNKLVAGIGSAANMLARGAGTADFSGQNLAVGENGFWTAGDVFGILGGSSKVTDEGIILFAGLIQDIVIGAYQEVQSRSWAFGSTHTNEGVSDVSEEFSTQFGLIMDSIVETVREGALALGLLPADIEAALAAYRIEEIRISLKDLTAEEQQEELTAVFSQIFDGLAGSVVPFIAQFQRVGEGLGETLVRIATEVQVAQIAFEQLGLVVGALDPEQFAQVSDALIEAAGGLDSFISDMQSFVANFSTDAHQFDLASSALATAFAEVGLTVPKTRDGMWDLMQSLDATTESGREQIATLLRLAGVADQYYSLLDKQIDEATKLLEGLGLASDGLSEFGRELRDIKQSELDAIEAANTIAVAQGRAGASAAQLARITQWSADQMAAAMRRLQQQTQDIIAELYGGLPGSLDGVNARITELESATGGLAGGIDSLADAGSNLFEQWQQGIQSVQDYLDSMLLGDLSALTPEQQLAEARRQLEAMQQAAMGGDAEALNQLPQLADAYLRLLRGFEASGSDYNQGFDWVRGLLQSVVGVPNPGVQSGSNGGTVEVAPSPELIALYAQRDALLAAQEGEHRRVLAEQLAQNLADMAVLLRVPILDMVELQGVSLAALAADLGVDLEHLTAGSVQALGGMAATLGISLTELTGALGLSLTDLSGGLTELTERVGIDLQNMTVESTQTLALLGTTLGADLSELATSLGIDLGQLADSQSLLNDALEAEIATLPTEQADALTPLLQAVEDATTEADANAAIQALEDAVNLLAPDIRTQLAPYLDGVFPADALSDLDYLGEIQSIAAEQLDVLGLIRDNLKASNEAGSIPSYAIGTGYVPATGLATIHEGEAIIPAPFASWMRSNGIPAASSGGNNERMVAELRAIRERLESLERSNSQGHRDIAGTVDQAGNRSDRANERALADLGSRNRAVGY